MEAAWQLTVDNSTFLAQHLGREGTAGGGSPLETVELGRTATFPSDLFGMDFGQVASSDSLLDFLDRVFLSRMCNSTSRETRERHQGYDQFANHCHCLDQLEEVV